MRFIPYITLNGNAAMAVDFYAKAFGATNRGVMRFGDRPPDPASPLPEGARNLVMHAELEVDGHLLYLSDAFPGQPYALGHQLAIAVLFHDEPRIKAVYNALVEGGKALMELQQTFWSPAFAMVTDKFGVTWQLSLEASR